MYSPEEEKVISYLKHFKGDSGLYVIRAKKGKLNVLQAICHSLGVEFKSDVAYVGKAAKLKTTNLYVRSRQEMGWSNFSGATFVKKIGKHLNVNLKKNNKDDQLTVRRFIIETFNIKCKILTNNKNLLDWETEQIKRLKSCLNIKKNK